MMKLKKYVVYLVWYIYSSSMINRLFRPIIWIIKKNYIIAYLIEFILLLILLNLFYCSFYDEKIKTNLLAYHSYHVLGFYKPPVTFPHHNLHVECIYNSMQRKCNRLLDVLNSNKKYF